MKWNAAFALYGGHGTTQSSTIVYEIEPGGHLGWHTDATEETQYIIAGSGELLLEDGQQECRRPGQRLCAPDAAASRSRQCRHGNPPGRGLFRRGDVHADVRQHDAPAKDSRPRHPESQRLNSPERPRHPRRDPSGIRIGRSVLTRPPLASRGGCPASARSVTSLAGRWFSTQRKSGRQSRKTATFVPSQENERGHARMVRQSQLATIAACA